MGYEMEYLFWTLLRWGILALIVAGVVKLARSGSKNTQVPLDWQRRLQQVEFQMAQLAQQVERLKGEGTRPTASASVPAPAPAAPEPEKTPLPVSDPAAPTWQASKPSPFAVPPAAAPSSSMEEQVAGKWFQWVAIISILFGVGYFLKLAFENNWIGEWGRVMLGWVAGIAFLGAGHHWITKYRGYAHGLIGGGLGLIYLSTFGAFQYYHLIPDGMAFFIMVLTTAVGVGLAILDDSQPLAVLSVLGGFLTPWLVSTGVDRQTALMSYLLLLNLGVLAVSGAKGWRQIRYGSFLVTVVYCLGWGFKFYAPEKLWVTLGFHAAFFLLFAGMAFAYNIWHRKETDEVDVFFSFANAFVFYLSSYVLLTASVFGGQYRSVAALLALALAGVYVVQAMIAERRRDEKQSVFLPLMLLGLGVGFVTVAIPVQLKASWITVSWAVEAAVLMGVGLRANHAMTRRLALAVFALVGFRLVAFDVWMAADQVVWNRRTLAFGAAIAAGFFAAGLLRGRRKQLTDAEQLWPEVLAVVSNVVVMWWLSIEAAGYWNRIGMGSEVFNAKQLSLSFLWLLYGSGLMTVGIMGKRSELRLLAIVTLVVTIGKVFLADLSGLHGGYRVLSLIGLGVILLAISFGYQRYRSKIVEFIKEGQS